MRLKKSILLTLYFASPLPVMLALYFSQPARYNGHLNYTAAMVLGSVAYAWLVFEFILAARIKWIETSFGMDKFFRFHGLMAVISVVLVLIHRTILEDAFDGTLTASVGTAAWLIFAGICIVTLLFMVNSIVLKIKPIFLLRKALLKVNLVRYEIMKIIHNLTAPTLVLLLVHLLLTSMARYHPLVSAIYVVYFAIGASLYVYHKFIKPRLLHRKHLIVSEIIEESSSMWTIKLVPQKGRSLFDYKPGQFCFIRLHGEELPVEEHPFSISSSPSQREYVSITVKALGDFTSRIKHIKAGDKAVLDAPYGRFSHLEHKQEEQTVLAVGGVGITPALSLLRYMRDRDRDRKVMLVWGINSVSDWVFRKELDEMQKDMKNLTIVPVIFKDDGWEGEKGYIDGHRLDRLMKQNGFRSEKAGVYICGPGPMLDSVLKGLRNLKFNRKQIHYEKFSL